MDILYIIAKWARRHGQRKSPNELAGQQPLRKVPTVTPTKGHRTSNQDPVRQRPHPTSFKDEPVDDHPRILHEKTYQCKPTKVTRKPNASGHLANLNEIVRPRQLQTETSRHDNNHTDAITNTETSDEEHPNRYRKVNPPMAVQQITKKTTRRSLPRKLTKLFKASQERMGLAFCES